MDSKITEDGDCSHEIERFLHLGRKAMTNLDRKKQRHYFTVKGLVFPVVMYYVRVGPSGRLSAEVLMLLTVVLEKILDSPLDCKEIKPVSSRKSVLNTHWKD